MAKALMYKNTILVVGAFQLWFFWGWNNSMLYAFAIISGPDTLTQTVKAGVVTWEPKKVADWYFSHCYFHSVSLICIHPCLCPRNSGPGIKLDKWFYLNLRILWTKERGQLTLNTWQNWRFWFDSQSDAVLKSNIQHFGHESLWTNISILLLFPQPCFNFLTENLVSHKSWLIMVTQTTYLTALSSGNFMMSCKKRPSWSG